MHQSSLPNVAELDITEPTVSAISFSARLSAVFIAVQFLPLALGSWFEVLRSPMWIMVSGPYTSGSPTPETRLHNLRVMNSAAVELFRRGHVPIIGVNMALPMIDAAGPEQFAAIMMPMSLALCERCDAVVRVGGPSIGADEEVERFRVAGKPVYSSIDQVPGSK